jgi:hypothetical protein
MQNEGLSAAGIDALLDAAYYAPDKALPLIITRFEVRSPVTTPPVGV